MFEGTRRPSSVGRNYGGPRRLANLALRRARQVRERLAAAPSAERKVQHLASWVLASAKGRPERVQEAQQALVELGLGWTWEDVAARPDSLKIADELKVEAYL